MVSTRLGVLGAGPLKIKDLKRSDFKSALLPAASKGTYLT
jgi:hypothetical protein